MCLNGHCVNHMHTTKVLTPDHDTDTHGVSESRLDPPTYSMRPEAACILHAETTASHISSDVASAVVSRK